MFACRLAAASDRARVYVTALGTLILLLELGLLPWWAAAARPSVSRLFNLIGASTYVVSALSLVERWSHSTDQGAF